MILVLVLFVVSVAGCGGGSEAGSGSGNDTLEGIVGTLVVEERLGKTVLDAWFEDNAPRALSEVSTVEFDTEYCVFNPGPVRTAAPSLVREETRIDVVSRSGTVARLLPHQINADTVYATDARWLSTPVPDDASVMFASSTQFQSMGAVSLPALEPLRWVAPVLGELDSANDRLEWVASPDADTLVKVTLSANHSGATGRDPAVVVCYLTDDGHYQLDAPTKQSLNAAGGSIVIRSQRVRTQTRQSGDTRLNVVQISHGRDA